MLLSVVLTRECDVTDLNMKKSACQVMAVCSKLEWTFNSAVLSTDEYLTSNFHIRTGLHAARSFMASSAFFT